MPLSLRLALRDWDYMTPLVLGDVSSPKLDIKVDRVGTLLSHVGKSDDYDVAEMSFSRYTQLRIDGDESVVGIPNFIMRGFRHRCIITRKDGPITELGQLAADHVHQLRTLFDQKITGCLLYTSPSPRDRTRSRMPSSA